ncbi:hypothetical protein DZB54_05895 [Herbaspirillum sp. 3R-3a1]|nr:hypothetical protein DZB54_05895 [Herbaspirillum sp. 3R-3a1]
MRRHGVRIPKHALSREIAQEGELSINTTQDNRLNRVSKTAKLTHTRYGSTYELMDVDILWIEGDNFALSGFEQNKNEAGEVVDYAQSWLCLLGVGRRLKTESELYEEQHARRNKKPAPEPFLDWAAASAKVRGG